MSFFIGLWQFSDTDDATKTCRFQHLFGIFTAVFDTIEKNGNEKCTTIIIEKCTILLKMLKITPLFSVNLPLLLCFLPLFEIQIVQKLQFFAAFVFIFAIFAV